MRLIDADAMTPETIIEIKRVFGRGGRLRTARTSVEVIRYSRLIDAPTLDYAPVRHGEWIDYDEANPVPLNWRYRCSLCGCPTDYAHNYCPNCGALMDGKEDAHG